MTVFKSSLTDLFRKPGAAWNELAENERFYQKVPECAMIDRAVTHSGSTRAARRRRSQQRGRRPRRQRRRRWKTRRPSTRCRYLFTIENNNREKRPLNTVRQSINARAPLLSHVTL